MSVVLIRDYACAPEGHTVQRFRMGDVLTGRAAEMALADDAAFEAQDGTPELEVKAKRGRPRK